MKFSSLLALFLSCCPCLIGQQSGPAEVLHEDLLESAGAELISTGDLPRENIQDIAEGALFGERLNLNEAGLEELEKIPVLDKTAAAALMQYLQQAGFLESIYELQAVPGLDSHLIDKLLPFVSVSPVRTAYNKFNQPVTEQKSRMFLRWRRSLEEVDASPGAPISALGSPHHLLLRYRFTQPGKLAAGFTAEKDAGEEFLRGSNRKGFDFYSGYWQIERPKRSLRNIILGDFLVSMGQGLVVYQGFGSGKNAQSVAIKRLATNLKPHGSVQEAAFFRGAALDFRLTSSWNVLLFASSRKRDANLITTEDSDRPVHASSLQYAGLHRTASEIQDRGALRKHSAGISARFRGRLLQFGINQLYEKLSLPLYPADLPHNQFAFRGKSLLNVSVDYALALRNFHFFGEAACSMPGKVALLNGLIISIDRKTDLVLLHRYYSRQYLSLNSNVFGESAKSSNERGLYLGLQAQISRKFQINLFFDTYRHDWIRFGENAPTAGFEWLVRCTYRVKRKMELYFQVRQENKYHFPSGLGGSGKEFQHQQSLSQSRLHLMYSLSKAIEWRSRVEAGYFTEAEGVKFGVMAYQEVVYKEMGRPFYCSTRYSFFNTSDYDVRFYAFERGLAGENSILPSFGQGFKFYLNAGFQLGKQWKIEGRFARAMRRNQAVLLNGLQQQVEVPENEVRLQLSREF
ncbi:MAG: hypothetical protein RI973_685 [Bacteroidota bacterium]|jgi:hypothetical protein